MFRYHLEHYLDQSPLPFRDHQKSFSPAGQSFTTRHMLKQVSYVLSAKHVQGIGVSNAPSCTMLRSHYYYDLLDANFGPRGKNTHKEIVILASFQAMTFHHKDPEQNDSAFERQRRKKSSQDRFSNPKTLAIGHTTDHILLETKISIR